MHTMDIMWNLVTTDCAYKLKLAINCFILFKMGYESLVTLLASGLLKDLWGCNFLPFS